MSRSKYSLFSKEKPVKYSKGGYKFNHNGVPVNRNGQNVMKSTHY